MNEKKYKEIVEEKALIYEKPIQEIVTELVDEKTLSNDGRKTPSNNGRKTPSNNGRKTPSNDGRNTPSNDGRKNNNFMIAMKLWQDKDLEKVKTRSVIKENKGSFSKLTKAIDIATPKKPNLVIENVFSMTTQKNRQILTIKPSVFSIPIKKQVKREIIQKPVKQQIIKIQKNLFSMTFQNQKYKQI